MSGLPDSAPNSLATALKQAQGDTEASVLAQGQGVVAERMVEVAAEHNIPVLQDFALSQALQKVPVGTQIPDPLFKALAGLLDYLLRAESTLKQQDKEAE